MGEQKKKKVSEEDALKEAEEMLKRLEEQKNKESKSKEENGLKVESGEEKIETKEKKDKSNEPRAESEEAEPVGTEDESEKSTVKSAKSVVKSAKSTPSTVKKSKGPKVRSKKYKEKLALVDRTKQYSQEEAIELVKKTSFTKFDGTIELSIKLLPPKNKKVKLDAIRGIIQLPHPTGKVPKVAIIDEAMAEKIIKNKKTEFDILLATPEMMPKIAKCAKILGPQGKMPNPKTGTVTTDPEKTIQEIKSGRVEYKSDDTGNVHIAIGKISFDSKKLLDNLNALINVIGITKIQNITLCATMGPGVKVVK